MSHKGLRNRTNFIKNNWNFIVWISTACVPFFVFFLDCIVPRFRIPRVMDRERSGIFFSRDTAKLSHNRIIHKEIRLDRSKINFFIDAKKRFHEYRIIIRYLIKALFLNIIMTFWTIRRNISFVICSILVLDIVYNIFYKPLMQKIRFFYQDF